MKNTLLLLIALVLGQLTLVNAQETDQIVENIIKEATENSELETMGHHLMDVIGPRLVGTQQMQKAHDWAVDTYKSWGIEVENQQWGEWRGWDRGITHIDLLR